LKGKREKETQYSGNLEEAPYVEVGVNNPFCRVRRGQHGGQREETTKGKKSGGK